MSSLISAAGIEHQRMVARAQPLASCGKTLFEQCAIVRFEQWCPPRSLRGPCNAADCYRFGYRASSRIHWARTTIGLLTRRATSLWS
jgi:hypothetical protein